MAKTKKVEWPHTFFSVEADNDYILCRHINFLGHHFHGKAGFFAQQACEKYMKALTVQHDGHYLETHKLTDLANTCKLIDPYFGESETIDLLNKIDALEQVGRYGAAANFDPLSPKGGNFKGTMFWSDNHLHGVDAFVFKIRAMLDFKAVGYNDQFASIMKGDKKSGIVGGWKGQPRIRCVLTRENRSIRGWK